MSMLELNLRKGEGIIFSFPDDPHLYVITNYGRVFKSTDAKPPFLDVYLIFDINNQKRTNA